VLLSIYSSIYRCGALDKDDFREPVKQKECQIIEGRHKKPNGVAGDFAATWNGDSLWSAVVQDTAGKLER
jgi:hypothetical protein